MKNLLFVPIAIAVSVPSVFAFTDIKNSDFETYINNMSNQKLISGYSDGTFRPNAHVSFIESLKIAINASDNYSQIIQNTDSWWMPYVDFYQKNFLQNSKEFANNDKISRDFAIYLTLRNLGISLTADDVAHLPNFPDVSHHNFFSPYITFAKYAGITSGYANGNFGPNNMVSRGEFTKMIWKTLREDKDAIISRYQEIKTSIKTTNTTKTEALSWLESVNGQYTNISELSRGANARFGVGSEQAKEVMKMVSNKEYMYDYKTMPNGSNNNGSYDPIESIKSTENITDGNQLTSDQFANLGTLKSVRNFYNGAKSRGWSNEKMLEIYRKNVGVNSSYYKILEALMAGELK